MGSFPVNLCAHITVDEEPVSQGRPSSAVVAMPLRLVQDYVRPAISELKSEDIVLIRRLPPLVPAEIVKRSPKSVWNEHLARRFQHIPEMQDTLGLIGKSLKGPAKDFGTQAENTVRATILLSEPVTQIIGRNQQWLVSDMPQDVAHKAGAFAVDLCGFATETSDHRIVSCDGAPLLRDKPEQAWARFSGLSNPAILPVDKHEAEAYRQTLLQHTKGPDRRTLTGGQSIRHVLSYSGAVVAVSNTKSSLGNSIGRLVMNHSG